MTKRQQYNKWKHPDVNNNNKREWTDKPKKNSVEKREKHTTETKRKTSRLCFMKNLKFFLAKTITK